MMEEKIRKTDRRSRYTCRVIKETLLALLKERPFTKINVSQLCRAADLTRGTFYLHYRDLYDVLDDVLEEALHLTEGDFTENEFWQLLELVEHDAAAL
ncbi:TetR/AcrR family transcriptional regulator, partial [uncultured Megasphaera sp.]